MNLLVHKVLPRKRDQGFLFVLRRNYIQKDFDMAFLLGYNLRANIKPQHKNHRCNLNLP